MKPFDYSRPASLAQALQSLARPDGQAVALAGGMTLLPAMKHGLAAPAMLVDLSGIGTLQGIERDGDTIVIGAMTRHADVARSDVVRQHLPALAVLAGGIGDAQVRHRGTLGGSVANNDPAADYPAACLALSAEIVTDRRTLPADRFFTGFFSTALAPGELITSVRFPLAEQAGYAKFASQASRYATVGVFVARRPTDVRLVVTGAGANGVFRVPGMERALSARFTPQALAGHGVAEEGLVSDLHASAAYRSHLINGMARRAVAASLGIASEAPSRHGGAVRY